jgi:Abortive infection alpha
MDPVTTGLIGVGVAAAAKRAEDFIAAACGHPGESIGTILGNMSYRRSENLEKIAEKSHFILLNIGEKPSEVPLNILHPLLDGASLQEDKTLQEVWANMLANAADPRQLSPVVPSFAIVLKELIARDVKMLDAIYQYTEDDYRGFDPVPSESKFPRYTSTDMRRFYSELNLSRRPNITSVSQKDWDDNKAEFEADARDLRLTIETLIRNKLIEDSSIPTAMAHEYSESISVSNAHYYCRSDFGLAFVRACRAPKRDQGIAIDDVL